MSGKRVRVAVVRCSGYGIDGVRAATARGLELLGGTSSFVEPGESILLKPNLLVGRSPERAVNTHPAVFRAVIEEFQRAGASVTYGDSPGFGPPETAARRARLATVARELGVPFADFSRGRDVAHPDGRLIKSFTLAAAALDADGIVSLPKLKTHGLTRLTGAIKNQFGCIPGVRKPEFHARLPNADLFSRMLVDLNMVLRPRLAVMDGIVAMEGNGPQGGSPRALDVLLFSRDLVAIDAVACRLIGLDPGLVLPIQYGAEFGLGEATEIDLVGDPIEEPIVPDFDANRSPRSTTGPPGRPSRLARRFVVPKPVIRASRCTKCGTCVSVCPVDPKAVRFAGDDRRDPPIHHYDDCIRCYCCQELCPENAIEVDVPLLGRLIHRR